MNNQDDETGHSPAKEVSMLPSNRHDQAKHPLGDGPKASLTLFRLAVSETLFNNFTPMGP